MSLTWQTTHKHGQNSLAHQFPFFQINAEQARSGAVKVEARSPSGRIMTMDVIDNNGVYTTNFTPSEVGDWMISILYEGEHIQGSPFNVRVYDAAQVKVFGLEGGAVGKTFSFSADCSAAGDGQLTVDITHNGRSVPADIRDNGRGVYRVSFTPDGAGLYTIRVHFAGMEVSGSPYTLEIVDSSKVSASGEGLSSVEVNRRACFIVNAHGAGGGDLKVNVTSPRGTFVPAEVFNEGNDKFRVEYVPSEIGDYLVDVQYYGRPITGSPFRVHASDSARIQVINLKSGGRVGQIIEFDIDASLAGSGNLEIMVNEGTIPCSVQNRGNRMFHASFMPKEPVPHRIQMRFNGKEVPGSPWNVQVSQPVVVTTNIDTSQLVPTNRRFGFDIRAQGGQGQVTATVLSPSKRQVPVNVVNNHSGTYRVEFTATETGSHLIELLFDGQPISGSPFTMKAFNIGAIQVSPVGSGVVGQPTEFTIDVSRAGEGQLEIMVNRGSVPNSVKTLSKGVFLVQFVPREPRPHNVEIKFNGEMVPGCPMTVSIMDVSRVSVQGEGIRQVAVNRQSQFRVNTQSAGEADLSVRVTCE